jgi:hypothetical protein
MLAKTFGQEGVDAMRDWMYNRYMNSNLAFRRSQGMSGGGSFETRDIRPQLQGVEGAHSLDPLANVAPTVARRSMIATAAPIGSVQRGMVTSYINLRSLIRDIHGAILDAPNTHLFDVNRANPALASARTGGKMNYTRLAHAAQSLIGDPATRGGGVWAQKLASSVPFLNIGVQSTAATLRSFRDHPVAWSAAAITPLIGASLAQNLSAIVSGPQHIAHLDQHLSNQQRESNVIMYHGPGTNPDQHTEVSLPQPIRWLWPVVNDLVSSGIAGWRHTNDPDTLSHIAGALSEMFSHHVSTRVAQQVALGASELAPISFPPGVTAMMGLGGGTDVGRVVPQFVERYQEGRPLFGTSTPGQPPKIPGQEGGPGEMSRSYSNALTTMIKGITGLVGDTAIKMTQGWRDRMRETNDVDWAMQGLTSDWKQTAAEQNRWGNSIWSAHLPVSRNGPIDEATSSAIRNIQATAGALQNERNLGLTRAKGLPVLTSGQSPVPPDPQMQPLYFTVSKFAQVMNTKFMPGINDIYKQLEVLKNSPMTADEKTRIANQLDYQLTAKKQVLMGYIEKLNDQLSRMAGGRVDMTKGINWNRGVNQFHP